MRLVRVPEEMVPHDGGGVVETESGDDGGDTAIRKGRRMTDEEDGDDVEDGRRTRRRTEQERDEKEWRARIERMLVQMDTREKRRVELDEQQVVLGRRLVAGVDWVGELLEGNFFVNSFLFVKMTFLVEVNGNCKKDKKATKGTETIRR